MCDGTRAMKDHVKGELEMLKLLGRSLVVLTDPDERGRWAEIPAALSRQ